MQFYFTMHCFYILGMGKEEEEASGDRCKYWSLQGASNAQSAQGKSCIMHSSPEVEQEECYSWIIKIVTKGRCELQNGFSLRVWACVMYESRNRFIGLSQAVREIVMLSFYKLCYTVMVWVNKQAAAIVFSLRLSQQMITSIYRAVRAKVWPQAVAWRVWMVSEDMKPYKIKWWGLLVWPRRW